MKKLSIYLTTIMLVLGCNSSPAQKMNSSDGYNLERAYEALKEEDDEIKAMDFVSKQIKETPDNAEALLLRMKIYFNWEEYGKALADINRAIKANKPQKTDIYNSVLYWWQSSVYDKLGDEKKAIGAAKTAYQLARKEKNELLQTIALDYGLLLCDAGDIEGSYVIFRNMLDDDETNVDAMYGIARVYYKKQQYDEALSIINKAIRIDDSNSDIYKLLSEINKEQGNINNAIDAAIEYVDKDSDPDWKLLVSVGMKNLNYTVANIKAKMKDSDYTLYWRAMLCELYTSAGNDQQALIELTKLEEEAGENPKLHSRKAKCYSKLGMFDSAINELNKAIEDDENWDNYCERGICYRLIGNFEQAIADFSSAIEEDPRFAFPYYSMGWCYELTGNYEKALNNYNLGIDIDSSYPYIFLQRGLVLKKMGRAEDALKDFKYVLAIDTIATDGSCTHYALHELGRDEEALEWMQKIIDENPSDDGNWYDQSCLYSRMGLIDDALVALEKAFECGYRDFGHMEHDYDMDPLRDLPRYKELVSKYKATHQEFLKKMDIPISEPVEKSTSEISFTRRNGGTFEVPCQINGLPLQMIFDTGATDVTISSVEANFMLKNHYLNEKDIKGKRYYQIATGELSAGDIITLREVIIGDVCLKDVNASVVKNQNAPLLIGQSALERFGAITIDNEHNKLIIKY
ncbi:MAG: tetratricopeptide repeat protein [Bacteroidaceae bacterium]|nr:tetratricopeptide repeat protein [Bacteroidaceae bacterium]